jgi:hypothetical protein
MMASKPQVSDIAAARFERLEAENAALRLKLAESDAKIAVFCRQYSDDNRFCVRLNRDQVRQHMRGNSGRVPCGTGLS